MINTNFAKIGIPVHDYHYHLFAAPPGADPSQVYVVPFWPCCWAGLILGWWLGWAIEKFKSNRQKLKDENGR